MKIFGILVLTLLASGCTSWNYHVDGKKVIFCIRSWNHDPLQYEVKGADAVSFRSISAGYAKDRFRVYLKGDVIPGADPTTFVILTDGFAQDSGHVFLSRCTLHGADPKSWIRLGDYWSHDARTVFHAYAAIPGANPTTFRYLGQNWSIDGTRAFHHLALYADDCSDPNQFLRLSVFENIDPTTFTVIDDFHAKDSRRGYDALKSPSSQNRPH